MSDTGTGAAPAMSQRTCSCLYFDGSYTMRMKFNIAGTKSPLLMRSESMISHTLTGSKARIKTWVVPTKMFPSAGVNAPTWNIGIGLM